MSNKNTLFPQRHTLNIRGKLFELDMPKVMGILNVTPNSFYDGGRLKTDKDILLQVEKMIAEGTDMIDIGGMSTKPASEEISVAEELNRVVPVVQLLQQHFPQTILSLDTYRAAVAKAGIEAGVGIINDISAGMFDAEMFQTVVAHQVPCIMMHIQGTPQTMQQNPQYENVVQEVLQYFIQKTAAAQQAGINDIIIDPGFGFGKTLAHNYSLLKYLNDFSILKKPLLVGLSRKSMICKLLEVKPSEALNGTTALHTLALLNGAAILRVHDVKEAKEVIKIAEFYRNNSTC
jgi:dihydropteroate synthase